MVLAVGGHLLGETVSRAVRWATPFAGGLGGTRQEICGALSGAAMVIGALYGRDGPEGDRQQVNALTSRFRERSLVELGATRCQDLYNQIHAQAPGAPGSCAVLTESAARLVLELLAEEQEQSEQPV
jgi:C_GCAxxG_C_C family probable redox protein